MNRNDLLHWFILGFGLSTHDEGFGRSTDISELWRNARFNCCDCDCVEVLDALYTLPREHASLIKSVSVGDGTHPVSFERVRNTFDWPAYFTSGTFHIKVLPQGRAYFERFASQMANAPHV
jgi:hypothetical protein